MGGPIDWPSTRETLIGKLQEQPAGPAWDLFVDIYGPLLYRFCRRRGAQDADARDITQNVFVAVGRGIRRFRYDRSRGKFRNRLGTIASRELGRHQQAERKASRPPCVPAVEVENDATWIVEFNSHVYQTALDRIRPDFEALTWQAFELLWKQELKPSEVAARLNKTPDWVYQVKYRVLRRLEKEVKFLTADIPSFSRETGP